MGNSTIWLIALLIVEVVAIESFPVSDIIIPWTYVETKVFTVNN